MLLCIEKGAIDLAKECVSAAAVDARDEFGMLETSLDVTLMEVEPTANTCAPLTASAAQRLLCTVLALPHGPVKMSHAVEGLVETSNNIAKVSLAATAGRAEVLLSTRSSVRAALDATRDRLAAIASLADATLELEEAYPGWQPNPASPLLARTKRIAQRVLGSEPRVQAIHAGLECGLLSDRVPGEPLDMISFGPTIEGAHSPDERVEISTVDPFYRLVLELLADLADER